MIERVEWSGEEEWRGVEEKRRNGTEGETD